MNEDLITRIFGEDGELDSPDEGLEEYKKRKKEAREKMIMLQSQPYEVKVRRSRLRAEEFMEQMRIRDKTAHVSVGGLDSITLHVFLKSIGINVPAVSVSSLEDKSIAYISFTSARYIIYSDIDETSHYAQSWSQASNIHDVVSLAQYVFPAGYLAIPSAYYVLAGPDVTLGVSGESFIINDQEYFIPGNTGSIWRIAIELPNLEQS